MLPQRIHQCLVVFDYSHVDRRPVGKICSCELVEKQVDWGNRFYRLSLASDFKVFDLGEPGHFDCRIAQNKSNAQHAQDIWYQFVCPDHIDPEFRLSIRQQFFCERVQMLGNPVGVIVMCRDAAATWLVWRYVCCLSFRQVRADVTALGLTYVAGILSNTTVWAAGTGPLPAKKWSGRGRPPKLLRRDAKHKPVSVKELALGLPKRAWRTIEWREGTAESLRSRFACVRVCVARRDFKRNESRPQEWLLIEWPNGEKEPTKYWLSTLPDDITLRHLVYFAKLRWRIERDYQELKQEVGLGHFEGRGWRGFHHHATLCIAAYGFLISEREAIPPSGSRSTRSFAASMLPRGHRPRGSAAAPRTARSKLDCHDAPTVDSRSRHGPTAMPLLRRSSIKTPNFVTQ